MWAEPKSLSLIILKYLNRLLSLLFARSSLPVICWCSLSSHLSNVQCCNFFFIFTPLLTYFSLFLWLWIFFFFHFCCIHLWHYGILLTLHLLLCSIWCIYLFLNSNYTLSEFLLCSIIAAVIWLLWQVFQSLILS